jgi:hypothetical protein
MRWAGVPQRSVDEDRDAMTNEDDVGADFRIRKWLAIDSEAKTSAVNGAHVPTSCRAARLVSYAPNPLPSESEDELRVF